MMNDFPASVFCISSCVQFLLDPIADKAEACLVLDRLSISRFVVDPIITTNGSVIRMLAILTFAPYPQQVARYIEHIAKYQQHAPCSRRLIWGPLPGFSMVLRHSADPQKE